MSNATCATLWLQSAEYVTESVQNIRPRSQEYVPPHPLYRTAATKLSLFFLPALFFPCSAAQITRGRLTQARLVCPC